MQSLYLRDDLQAAVRTGELAVSDDDVFAALSATEGEVYRRSARRRTSRVVIGDKTYFAKVHEGVGWREIAKNLLAGKRPVLGARHDFEASRRLRAEGVAVPEVAAFGERGVNPARRRSFAIHDALEGFCSLEDVGHARLWGAAIELKRALLIEAGRLTAAMHAAGVCHRDYYACHLMANAAKLGRGEAELAVIDLHRAEVHRRLSRRARVRDLGALLYSTSAMPLTERDRLRFVAAYAGTVASVELRHRGGFWRAVVRRAERLHARAVVSGLASGAAAIAGAEVASVGRLADLDRDPPLPFRFDLTLGEGGVRAICTAVLRAQPGRRTVLRATVDGRELILKAFFGPRADRDSRRERRGVTALRESGVATPELLGIGRGGGARILAFELLDDAREPSVGDVEELLATLARMHRGGIRQRDLHPGNFLVSGTRVFAIDGGGVAVSKLVRGARCVSDVARLLAHYPSHALGSLAALTTAYEGAAGVVLPKRTVDHLDARVARARRHRLAKFMAKTHRDCTAFSVREEPRRRIVVERGDDDPWLEDIIADPDRAVASGEPLKRGNTAAAVRCGDFVVKRYNVKDPWHRHPPAVAEHPGAQGLACGPRPAVRRLGNAATACLDRDAPPSSRRGRRVSRRRPCRGGAARSGRRWGMHRSGLERRAGADVRRVAGTAIRARGHQGKQLRRQGWRHLQVLGSRRRRLPPPRMAVSPGRIGATAVRFLANWPDPPASLRDAVTAEPGVGGERT